MANHPIPDNVPSIMQQQFGTIVLITDPAADRLLAKKKNNPPVDRYSRHCGGKGGFDDFVERWHE